MLTQQTKNALTTTNSNKRPETDVLMFDQIEPTLLGLASGVEGWTSVDGPMSLAVRAMEQQGLVETQNDDAPKRIEYRLTEAGQDKYQAQVQ